MTGALLARTSNDASMPGLRMVPLDPWPHCAERGETTREVRASEVTSPNGTGAEGTGIVPDGTSRALPNSGDGRRAKDVLRLLISGIAVLAGLVVVGGGIALFLSTLFG
jgi:hypothetical protein